MHHIKIKFTVTQITTVLQYTLHSITPQYASDTHTTLYITLHMYVYCDTLRCIMIYIYIYIYMYSVLLKYDLTTCEQVYVYIYISLISKSTHVQVYAYVYVYTYGSVRLCMVMYDHV